MARAFRRSERRRILLAFTVILTTASLLSCRSQPDTPEARVRATLEKAQAAAENKDLGTLGQLVSDNYTDDLGQDKQTIMGILTFHFFRNQSIYLLTRVHGIAFPEPARAETTVYVATAGQPIRGAEELVLLRADLFRFDFVFADEGKGAWKVTTARWRRVEPADFLWGPQKQL